MGKFKCNKCGKELDLKWFGQNKAKSLGHNTICKICNWFRENKHKYNPSEHLTNEQDIQLIKYSLTKPYKDVIEISKNMNIDLDIVIRRINELNLQNLKKIKIQCKICEKSKIITLSQYNGHNLCSRECYTEYMSKYNIGENNSNFKQIKIKCDNCGKMFYKKPSRIKKSKNDFCSTSCMHEWFRKNVYNNEDYKEFHKLKISKQLERGDFSHTDTKPQIILNNILDELKIEYINEKRFDFYNVDSYIEKYNIPIEVMGTYWHTDPRFYTEINYSMQLDVFPRDKAKNTFFRKKYDREILYLWEYDLENNIDDCKNMILDYIKFNGELKEYHSFNYKKENRIRPYMEYSSDEIRNIINLDIVKLRCKKDEGKYTKFKCDFCGKDCEELTSHFRKNNSHCCSRECSGKLQTLKNRKTVSCCECGKIFSIKNSAYKRNKNKKFYCSRECQIKNSKLNEDIRCENCGKSIYMTKIRYSKSKTKQFFCNRDCYNEFKRREKDE